MHRNGRVLSRGGCAYRLHVFCGSDDTPLFNAPRDTAATWCSSAEISDTTVKLFVICNVIAAWIRTLEQPAAKQLERHIPGKKQGIPSRPMMRREWAETFRLPCRSIPPAPSPHNSRNDCCIPCRSSPSSTPSTSARARPTVLRRPQPCAQRRFSCSVAFRHSRSRLVAIRLPRDLRRTDRVRRPTQLGLQTGCLLLQPGTRGLHRSLVIGRSKMRPVLPRRRRRRCSALP